LEDETQLYIEQKKKIRKESHDLFAELEKEYGKGIDKLKTKLSELGALDIYSQMLPQFNQIREAFADIYGKVGVKRDMAAEDKAIGEFGGIHGHLPSSSADWAEIRKMVYGTENPIFLQHGGSISGGQTAMVGEAGPERITPRILSTVTPNNQTTSNTISINFGGVSVRNESDITSIIDQIKEALSRDGVLAEKGAL